MSNEDLKQLILSLIPDAIIEDGKQYLLATIPSEKIHFLSENIYSNPNASFDYLFCVTGVDWLSYYSIVYHLTSTTHSHTLVIKAKIADHDNPIIDSVCGIWKTAEFHEREIYDLFGIKFNNHPDLRRILLEDDREGFPLRKDYKDDLNIVEL